MDPTAEIVKIPDGEGLFEIMPNPYIPDDAEKINYPQLGVRGIEIEGRNPAFVRGHVSVVRDNREGVYIIVGEESNRALTKKILAGMSQKGNSISELGNRLKKAKAIGTIDVIFIPHKDGVVEGDLYPILICKGAPDFIITARNRGGRTVLTTREFREKQRRYLAGDVKREEIEELHEVLSQSGGSANKVNIIFASSDRPFLTVRKV